MMKKTKLIRGGIMALFVLAALLLVYLVVRQTMPDIIPLLRSGDEEELEAYLSRDMSFTGILYMALLQMVQVWSIVISGVIVTGSPLCSLSNANSAVIIFVVLATGSTSRLFFSNKTVPLTGSYSTAAYAETLTDSAVSAETGRLPHTKTTASKTQSIFRKNHHLPRHVYAAGG